MNRKFCALTRVILPLLLITLLLSACDESAADPNDRETFPKETFVEVPNAAMTYRGGLNSADYPADTRAGEWLAGCADSDRDEQFDVYTLRHEATEGDKTTFTYLIYYPHGGEVLTATPELLEGESGYVINLSYTAGDSTEDDSLSYLSVTLPTDKAPRLRLIRDGEVLGQLASVTEDEIG